MNIVSQMQLLLVCMLHTAVWGVFGMYQDPCNDADATAGGDTNRLWPGGIITYTMNKHLPRKIVLTIEKEIELWERSTCIKFVPRVTHDQKDYVFFILGDNNCAYFGKKGSGMHIVSLANSISNNQTALNIIFAKMIGIRNSTLLLTNFHWSHEPLNGSNETKGTNSTVVPRGKDISLCDKINACGDVVIINSDDGLKQHLITSPGYPHGYKPNLDCVWSIYNRKKRLIHISFKGSSLEPNPYYDCSTDFVEIIMTHTEGDQELDWRRLCHKNDFQEIINTNSSKITIQFHSDASVNGTGFIANITWRELCTLDNGGCEHLCVPSNITNDRICKCHHGFELSEDNGTSCKDIDECQVNKGGCSQECVNTVGAHYCQCRLGYSLYPDNVTCEECLKTYTDVDLKKKKTILIFSPQYPGVYNAHHNCVWKFKSEKPQFYKLSFKHFHLNYSPNCTVDYLNITDKTNKLKLPRLCGIHHRIEIVSRTAELTIHFKTKTRGGTGFWLIYQLVERQQRYIRIDDNQVKGSKYNLTYTSY